VTLPAWPTATTELAPGVFAYVQADGGLCIANAGILAGDRGATVVDALFTPSMTRALLDASARVASQPVECLINTHHHVDHTLGNRLLPPKATIIAHAKARHEMERAGVGVLPLISRLAPHFAGELAGIDAARLPDTTFEGDALQLTIGVRRARLLHFGAGHTTGDVLVYLPAERILFAGDLAFFYVTPLAHEGHIGGWIENAWRIIDEINPAVIVPGHGPVGTNADLQRMLGYLELIRREARRAYDAGADAEEAARSIDLGEYGEWREPERVRPNVTRLFQEFRGELDALRAPSR
jgi:cyclase